MAARDGAAGRDNLKLNPKMLDGVDDAAEEMDLERVQEQDGNDSDGGRDDVRRKNIVDPIEHGDLIKPCL